MRTASRVLLGLYLICLLWLTLFKLSYDIVGVIADYRTRSLNLIPFVTLGQTGLSETVSNVVTFVPFGILLALNFAKAPFWRLVLVVLVFSVTVETLQYVLAIGTTDATDVVTNTLGGLVGIGLFRLVARLVDTAILDRVVVALGAVLFVAFLLLRVLVFRVRY